MCGVTNVSSLLVSPLQGLCDGGPSVEYSRDDKSSHEMIFCLTHYLSCIYCELTKLYFIFLQGDGGVFYLK